MKQSKSLITKKTLIAMFIVSILLLVPIVSLARASDVPAPSAQYGNTVTFPSPIDDETVDDLVASIADWLTGIVAGIAVIMIMVGGFMYVTSMGDPTKAKKGIEYIRNSVIGLAIILGANIIIDEIRYLTGAEGAGGGFSVFANTFIGWFLTIIVGVSVLMIIYAGYLFLTGGGGEEKKIAQAKSIIKYTVVGIIVAILSASMINFVLSIF